MLREKVPMGAGGLACENVRRRGIAQHVVSTHGNGDKQRHADTEARHNHLRHTLH